MRTADQTNSGPQRRSTPGVVVEIEAGQRLVLRPLDGRPGSGSGGITVALEHKSGRHARLRIVAEDHIVERAETVPEACS